MKRFFLPKTLALLSLLGLLVGLPSSSSSTVSKTGKCEVGNGDAASSAKKRIVLLNNTTHRSGMPLAMVSPKP